MPSQTDATSYQGMGYNLLKGELLVSGRSLGRFSQEYINSDLYVRIFDFQIFFVCAFNMSDMLYMSVCDVKGYQLHFDKKADNIVIRIRTKARIWETISH